MKEKFGNNLRYTDFMWNVNLSGITQKLLKLTKTGYSLFAVSY